MSNATLQNYVTENLPEAAQLAAARPDVSICDAIAAGIYTREAGHINAHEKYEAYLEHAAAVKNISRSRLSETSNLILDIYDIADKKGFQDIDSLLGSDSLKKLSAEIEKRFNRGGTEEVGAFAENALLLPVMENVAADTMPNMPRDAEFEKTALKEPSHLLLLGTKVPDEAAKLTSAKDIETAYKAATDYEQPDLPMEDMMARLEIMAAGESLMTEFKQSGSRQGGLIWALKYVNDNLGYASKKQSVQEPVKEISQEEKDAEALSDFAFNASAFHFHNIILEDGCIEYVKKNPETAIAMTQLYGRSSGEKPFESFEAMKECAQKPEVIERREKIKTCFRETAGSYEDKLDAIRAIPARKKDGKQPSALIVGALKGHSR